MSKGIYCLVIRLATHKTLRIGALGKIDFAPGYYLYVGSALGSGGMSRIDRHVRFSQKNYMKPKWHIDYLDSVAPIVAVFSAETEERLECALARAIGGTSISGFGCSDCSCQSHLFYREHNPLAEIDAAFSRTGLLANRTIFGDPI
ncbi:MAG TPA: GIY-YIG nuclease family protein [Methanocorpusculum sp.]|nr:GIY-YIG nuclease family protein [Methanocorpusculum sp.]